MTEAVLGVKVGDRAEFEKTVTAEDVQRFADVSGDTNPLHRDPAYAAKTRFGQCIAHGMLSAGFISAALGTKLAPNCCVIYLSQSLRFLRPGRRAGGEGGSGGTPGPGALATADCPLSTIHCQLTTALSPERSVG